MTTSEWTSLVTGMNPFYKKPRAGLRADILDKITKSGAELIGEAGKGWKLGKYVRGGKVDYDAYRIAQDMGNQAKIEKVYADPALIALIVEDAKQRLGEVKSVLCHGSRNGAEVRWFLDHLPDAEILGTDIADSASLFPNTIQWDFHDKRKDWRDKWDVIYSNSWDHAVEPLRAFGAWSYSLKNGGLLYLEHADDYLQSDPLDLFAASKEALIRFVSKGSAGAVSHVETIGEGLVGDRSLLVFRKG